MMNKYNPALVGTASGLRRNMTDEEKRLWYDFLKNYGVKFIRQKVMGKYIVDFYSAGASVVLEIDGAQHYTAEGKEYDAERTQFLESYGLMVIRIPNSEVNGNFSGVCAYIDRIVKKRIEEKKGLGK